MIASPTIGHFVSQPRTRTGEARPAQSKAKTKEPAAEKAAAAAKAKKTAKMSPDQRELLLPIAGGQPKAAAKEDPKKTARTATQSWITWLLRR